MKVITLPTTRIRNLVMIEKDRDGFEGSCIPGALCKGFFDSWWQIGADRIHGDVIQCRTAGRVRESRAVSAILIHGRFPRPPILAVKRAVTQLFCRRQNPGEMFELLYYSSLSLQENIGRTPSGFPYTRFNEERWPKKPVLCTSRNVHSRWAIPTIDSACFNSRPIQHCRQHVEKTLLFAECS